VSNERIIRPKEDEVFDIELEEDFLQANREIADKVHTKLEEQRVLAIDVMGSVGSGKTSLIEATVERLKGRYRMAMIAGDVATTIDADRVERHGVPTVQINTGKECHLDANLVMKALDKLDLDDLDILFIENVGNLICPGDFPIGAQKRVVIISVTEGPYMVVKHPLIFQTAEVVAINKIDLASAMGVDPDALVTDAVKVNPRIKAVKVSVRNGQGLAEFVKALGLEP
jgi:hydrogenase nickel incorporation protein HypB